MARIQKEDFDVGREIRLMAENNPGAGAVTSFLGTVRDFSRGQEIARLEFEHYPGMAEAELARLEEEARRNFSILDCMVIHRTGQIGVGGNIVLIAVASAHRPAGFQACQWLIDELKRRIPIWKKEFASDGSYWVEDHP